MITPRLLRRAAWRGAQWRLLLIWWASLLMPLFIAGLPLFAFLDRHLGHTTRAVTARLDGSTLLDLLRQLGEDGASQAIGQGIAGAAVVLLFSAPFAAGAAVAAAQTDEPLDLRRLSAGAAGLYGRMLRALLCGLVPLALAGALGGGSFFLAYKANQKLISESAADRRLLLASLFSALLLFLAHLLIEATRAHFAAEPARRSAWLSLWSAVKLVRRWPLRALSIGAAGAVVAVLPAALLMALRLQIVQKNAFLVLIAWLLAQGAQLAVGWGRNLRIFGFTELIRADMALRARLETPIRLTPPLVAPVAPEPAGLGELAPLSKGQGPAI